MTSKGIGVAQGVKKENSTRRKEASKSNVDNWRCKKKKIGPITISRSDREKKFGT